MGKDIMGKNLLNFISWVKAQEIDFSVSPQEFGYENPNLILIDAVLSINRPYKRFVLPRVKNFQQTHGNILKLQDLRKLIDRVGKENFKEVWNYNHLDRVEILSNLVNFFLSYKKEHRFSLDLKAMKHWAQEYHDLSINGVGFKTTQYLRMMSGIPTVKPDVHIHRAVVEALGKKLSDASIVDLLEKTASKLGVSATSLDHGIWKLKSLKS